MVKRFIAILLIIPCLFGCAYSVYSNAYPYLKRVQLMALDNKSTEFGLGDIVYNTLSDTLRIDGRLRQVTQQPDCQISGSILSYTEKIFSYDEANSVQDYQITITFSITFTDLKNNQVLYDNKSLPLSEVYAVGPGSTSRFKTKQDCIREICYKLFRNIMQNTLETW